jgi:hypothetical protein
MAWHGFRGLIQGAASVSLFWFGRGAAKRDDRYPSSQWRMATLIEDTHVITLDEPLPPGEYHVVVGLYRLSDGAHLPVTPAEDERVVDNGASIYTLTED